VQLIAFGGSTLRAESVAGRDPRRLCAVVGRKPHFLVDGQFAARWARSRWRNRGRTTA
jgi:hypothetical protein